MINMIELPPQDLKGLVQMISYLITTVILRERNTVHNNNKKNILILQNVQKLFRI